MKTYGVQLTEYLSWPVADMSPANTSNSANAVVIGPVLANQFRRYLAKVRVGVLTGLANVGVYLQACNTSNGVFTNISATNQVALTNTSNTAVTVECRADQLPAGSQYIQAAVLVSANAAFVGGELICADANYDPAKQFNINTLVSQIVY